MFDARPSKINVCCKNKLIAVTTTTKLAKPNIMLPITPFSRNSFNTYIGDLYNDNAHQDGFFLIHTFHGFYVKTNR